MVLEQLDIHMQKKKKRKEKGRKEDREIERKKESRHRPFTEINSKWVIS